jgi:hypothetical protein
MTEYQPDLIIVRAAAEQALQLSFTDYNARLIEMALDRRAAIDAQSEGADREAPAREAVTLIMADPLAKPRSTGSADDYQPDRLIGTIMAAPRHASHQVAALLTMLLDGSPVLPSDPAMRGQVRRSLARAQKKLAQETHRLTLVRPAGPPGELLLRPAPPAPTQPPERLLRPEQTEMPE